jgi:hypothetical protein
MTSKLEQVKVLVAQGKYKSALPVLRKINQKPHHVIFESLDFESVCLFKQKTTNSPI